MWSLAGPYSIYTILYIMISAMMPISPGEVRCISQSQASLTHPQ